MADMTWGAEYVWPVLPAVHQAQQMQSCRIGEDKFVIAYIFAKAGDPENGYGRALVGSVSGTAITYGATAIFNASTTHSTGLHVRRIDDTRFAVVYVKQVGGVNEHLYAKIGTVAPDGSIAFGPEVDISGSAAETPGCWDVSDSKFMISWNDSGLGDIGRACVCTVAGDVITPGALTTLIPNLWRKPDMTLVGTDKLFGVWRNHMTADLDGAVFTISGTTPTMHAIQIIDAGTCKEYFISYMGNDKVVVTWTEGAAFVNMHGQACIVEIAGTAFTFGAFVETQEALPVGQGPYHPDVVAIWETNFVFVFSIPNANHGTSRWCTVDGATITLGAKEEWSAAGCAAKDVLYLRENTLALPFIEGLGGPEKAIIGGSPVTIPVVTTNPATSITAIDGILNGTLDFGGGEACDCGFEWGETVAYGNTTPTQSRVTGQTFAQTIIGLSPNTTYHFRAFATNSVGTIYGIDRTFKALVALSTVTTDPATDTSIVNGTLDDDGGEACDCGFEWGLTVAYGNTTPTQSKTTGQSFSQPLGALAPGTTYHFRAFATNAAGTSYGADRVLATPGSLPIVTTDPATLVSMIAAALNGTLDDDGGLACDCGFEWGTDISYGIITPTDSKVTGETFLEALSSLFSGTTYHFRAFATNADGTAYGADRSFTTTPTFSRAFALAREEL